ncbi:hypothetical protein CRG98_008756 [Punica granatum]|uniref:G-patch domain-containing protein n=1 Tax=Punica granatum TaxID=22663 RepID=A0A2I0KQU1_PUNGR|nr:hypothetical protein CRG98_008756 [Punica granatum]
MEETIRALQAGTSRLDFDDSDWNLFPGMLLPPKIKIPDFKSYDGTKDPRHHLRHYHSKMLSYWDYEEFVIQTFQDSLTGSALDWFMTLKAGDVPTWTDLSQKFLHQYRFCAETPLTLLDLSMTEMRESQTFEAYAMEWRGKAAKHIPPIIERQQAYFPTPPTVIQSQPPQQYAPAQGNAAQPCPRKQYTTLPAPPSHIFRQLLVGNKIITEAPGPHFDPSMQNQNLRCEFHQGAPGHTLDTCWRLRDKIQEMINTRQISFNEAKLPNVCTNPFPDHGSGPGPSVDMIIIAAIEEEEDSQKTSIPFVINYAPAEVAFASVPFVIEEPYQDSRVPWTYEGEVASAELEMSVMGITRSGRVYQGPKPVDKGKAPATAFTTVPEVVSLPTKKVTDQEAEAFMKVIKASEYKVVEQMSKSPAHISLLSLLLSSEPHRDALLKVLTAAQVPKKTTPERIEETGQGHLRALHIFYKCNNHVVSRVMIDNGSALNVCPVSTLKQMNVDMSRIHASKTTVRAFDGSRRDVNGEIDLLIDVGPCSFSVTFQILEISNAFSLLLGRPWIHATDAVPSSLHQKLKFFVEGKLITVNSEEDYAVYKETTVLLKNNYVPGTGLGARAQGIFRPVEVEEYRNKRGLDFRPSCNEIVQARRGKYLHRLVAHYGKLFRGILVPPLSQFFAAPSQIMGGTSDSPITESDDFSSDAAEAFLALLAIYAVTEETSSRVHIRPVREDEELTNWTLVPFYSAIVADV